jgi:hypothetical protein
MGAYWRTLTNTTISIFRREEDTYAPDVRVRIWRMAQPDFDSGFVAITSAASPKTLSHNLMGNWERYLVHMNFYQSSTGFVHQRYYGGAVLGKNPVGGYSENDSIGAYWDSLDKTSIAINRLPQDGFVNQAQIRIWKTPPKITLNQIIDHILGIALLNPRLKSEADTNGDFLVNIGDAIYLINDVKR